MNPTKHFIDKPGEYVDALGRPLKIGDVVTYPTSKSSSVYVHYARVVDIKPTNVPIHIGSVDPGDDSPYHQWERVYSWGHAFELKVEYLQWDRMKRRFVPPTIYDRTTYTYRELRPDEKRKTNTIKRVDRVLRLDLDV